MSDEKCDEIDDALMPEEGDQTMREAQEQMRELEKNGWEWRGEGVEKLLVHPDDPEMNIWFHPYTGEQLLSPKLVQRLVEDARRDRHALGDNPPAADDPVQNPVQNVWKIRCNSIKYVTSCKREWCAFLTGSTPVGDTKKRKWLRNRTSDQCRLSSSPHAKPARYDVDRNRREARSAPTRRRR